MKIFSLGDQKSGPRRANFFVRVRCQIAIYLPFTVCLAPCACVNLLPDPTSFNNLPRFHQARLVTFFFLTDKEGMISFAQYHVYRKQKAGF